MVEPHTFKNGPRDYHRVNEISGNKTNYLNSCLGVYHKVGDYCGSVENVLKLGILLESEIS